VGSTVKKKTHGGTVREGRGVAGQLLRIDVTRETKKGQKTTGAHLLQRTNQEGGGYNKTKRGFNGKDKIKPV